MTKFKALPFLLLFSILAVQVDSKQIPEDDKNSRNNERLDKIEPVSYNRAAAVSVASSAAIIGGGDALPSLTAADTEADRPNQRVGSSRGSLGRPKARPDQTDGGPINEVGDQDDIPTARPNRARRPVRTRRPPPATRPDDFDDGRRYDADDEECDDNGPNEYDYGPNFFNMATRPMRQFTNMMGSVFDQMQGLASGRGGKSNKLHAM